jgi:hypothetical protein
MDECADECGECYRGPYAFSEPETIAIRDFLTDRKDEIKFSFNFHSYGNTWMIPFNGVSDNNLQKTNPKVYGILQEISDKAPFPEGMKHEGNSQAVLGQLVGGDADDYITGELGIPSVTPELGTDRQYIDSW